MLTWEQIQLLIPVWALAGVACAWIATKKNRNPFIWFVAGFFFSLFGIILLLILPPGLQIRKKNPSFSPPSLVLPEISYKSWFYLDRSNTQQGPLDFISLSKSWKEHQLSEQTYLWSEGMENWKKAHEIPEFLKQLNLSHSQKTSNTN